MKTLNEQYRLIKEGKGHKGLFINEAKRQFPNFIRNAADFKETTGILKNKGIINENVVGLGPISHRPSSEEAEYETSFKQFLEEAKKEKAEAEAETKEVSKEVEEDQSKNFDNKDMENPDNVIFDQLMSGYYYEMKNPKNSKKTMEELKSLVLKNLAKNPIYYAENGQFGVEGVGYETEVPGLGTPKEPKGPYKSSGYGTLKEDKVTKSKLDESHQPGDKVIYNGTKYEVVDEDEFIITLKDGKGNITKQNYNQFKKGKYKPSLQETKLRKVINILIREELEDSEVKVVDINRVTDGLNSNLQERKVRKVINKLVRQGILAENKRAQATIKEIEEESKKVEVSNKMEALETAIEMKQKRLSTIAESEELKDLTDKVKVKELEKEIKELEKYLKKVTKISDKLNKVAKPKSIDDNSSETNIIDEDTLEEAPTDDMTDMETQSGEIVTNLEKASKIKLEGEEEDESNPQPTKLNLFSKS